MKNSEVGHSEDCRSVTGSCRQVRRNLPAELLNDLDEQTSSGLFQHISQCRGCLELYASLQAAAELACPTPDYPLASSSGDLQ